MIYSEIAAILGDQDGDSHRSVECGGDDCDDSEWDIYPGEPCFNKCFDDVLKGGICQAGTGECIYDSVIMNCEEMGDPCRLDRCVEVSGGDDVCSADTGPNLCGGLVPCGRSVDDPTTPYHEDDNCTLCHLILMMQLIMDFLFKIAAVVAALFIAASGTMYIFATGRPEMMSLAKTTFKLTLLGFTLIFIAWILVNTILTMFGYIDPLENNEWHIMC